MRVRALPVALMAAALVAGGCSSELPRLDASTDWAQREQDRHDTGQIIEDATGSTKKWTDQDYRNAGIKPPSAPPAGFGRAEGDVLVWSEAARAWVGEGTTERDGATWSWVAILRNLDSDGASQEDVDENTERIEYLLSADMSRILVDDDVTFDEVGSWTAFSTITGLGSGTLTVVVGGTMDGRIFREGFDSDISVEFSAAATVPEDTDECPTGEFTARIDGWTVRGVFDAAGEELDWEAFDGSIDEGEEPFDSGSDPFVCEASP